MCQILAKLGYACHDHTVLVIHKNFCWVGHTASKTKEMVKKTMDGVLTRCTTSTTGERT